MIVLEEIRTAADHEAMHGLTIGCRAVGRDHAIDAKKAPQRVQAPNAGCALRHGELTREATCQPVL
jgi:hypothetical protein